MTKCFDEFQLLRFEHFGEHDEEVLSTLWLPLKAPYYVGNVFVRLPYFQSLIASGPVVGAPPASRSANAAARRVEAESFCQ